MDQRMLGAKRPDPVNEIRFACERCMAELGRYVSDRNQTWFRAQCNLCHVEKVTTWVESFTEKQLGWERV